eukprot:244087_1
MSIIGFIIQFLLIAVQLINGTGTGIDPSNEILDSFIAINESFIWRTTNEKELVSQLQPLVRETTQPKEFYDKMIQIYKKCSQIKTKLGTVITAQHILYSLFNTSFYQQDTAMVEQIFWDLIEMDYALPSHAFTLIELVIFNNNV